MKKIIKKIVIILIVFILMFEYCCSSSVYAVDEDKGSVVPIETLNAITNLTGGLVSIILWIPRILAIGFASVINQATLDIANVGNEDDHNGYLTPFNIFFSTSTTFFDQENDNYEILSVNFFKTNSGEDFIRKFRTAVATWFYIVRFIALAILLCVLVYVGIRMALSSVAEDRAKYKKMLTDWVCSVLLVFLLQYIIMGVVYGNDAVVAALKSVAGDENKGFNDFMNSLALQGIVGVGIDSIVSVLVYCAIVGQTIFFLIAYINRMLKVGFLIVIAPLISITYSIDKMGDGKAQALNNWLKEFIFTVIIQPFHCIMYLALIRTAMQILLGSFGVEKVLDFNQLASGVLVILCLKFINDGEQILRKIFGFSDDNSKTSMAAGAVAAVALLNNAKKIGGSTRKGINTARSAVQRFSNATSADRAKIGKYLGNTKAGIATKNLMDKLGNTEPVKGLQKGLQTAKSRVTKLKNKATTLAGKYSGSGLQKVLRKNASRALGMMGMAMAYATGNTGLLEANATGMALSEGSQEFFNTSRGNLAESQKDNVNALEQAAYEELKDDLDEANGKIAKLGFEEDITADEAKNIANSDEAKAAREARKKAEEKTQKLARELDLAYKRSLAAQKELAEAQAAKNSGGRKGSKRRKKEKERLKKAEAEALASEKSLQQLRRGYNKAKDLENEAAKQAAKYDSIEAAVQRRDSLKKAKENFNSPEARRARMVQRMSGPSAAELQKKKDQILQLMMKIKMKQEGAGEGDSTHENVLTEDERDSTVRTTDRIIKSVEAGVLKGGASGSVADKVLERTGLNSRATSVGDSAYKAPKNAEKVQDATEDSVESYKIELEKAMRQYEILCRKKAVADTFGLHGTVSTDSDKLVDSLCSKLRGVNTSE